MAGASLSFLTALRFSRGRKRGGMVSLISVISTIGIALGVAVLIVGLSAMNGFERELKNRILAVVPHGELEPVNQPFSGWPSILQRVEKVPGIVAAAPYINFTGLMENGAQLRAVEVKGVDPQQESRLSALPQYVQGDAWANFKAGEQQVILGKGVADALGVKQGAYVTVMIPNSDPEMKLLQPKRIRLHVTGILQLSGAIMYLAMVLVIGVACFNIVSTLVMAVKDKSADIAVLRTLGAKDGFIRAIFIWYGLLAGLLGSLSGVVIGVIASLQLTNIIRGIEKLVGHSFLSGDIYFIDFLPSELHWLDVLIVLATAIVLSLLASWYPARRASRIDPARVLSGQ